MTDGTLSISTVLDNKVISVGFNKQTTVEDVCTSICKQLGIGPVARQLFSLRVSGKEIFLPLSATFTQKECNYDFRLRYKIENALDLKKIDVQAYDYYFYQSRSDVIDGKIPCTHEDCRGELLGLGAADMYRIMLEKDIPREIIQNDYKKYVPKKVLFRHHFFLKKPICEALSAMKKAGYDASYVKAVYLKQLEMIAPEYCTEKYDAYMDQNGSVTSVAIKLLPHHSTEPGLLFRHESKKDWIHICAIQDLCFVSVRKDRTVEISRKNGIPFHLTFKSLPVMFSFVSLLDGYYRLTCKWTFNLCKDVTTPSLKKLYLMKCHGPVGGEFSYAKLEEKSCNRPGSFILRESETKYSTYFIDVCTKDSLKPKTFKLERLNENEFIFNDDLTRYRNIAQLMAAYNDPEGDIYLKECLPPSEYDKSPLLLCKSTQMQGDLLTDSSAVQEIVTSGPLCINSKNIQVYKGQKKEGLGGVTVVYRSMWRLAKGKKTEVAMKVLKHECSDKYFKEFLELAGQWAFLQSSAIIKLFGITLISPVSMVMEYMRYGPLDHYLRANREKIKVVDLIEASSNLASALWHLEENGIVHGNIRCRKLFVNFHEENSFVVKLGDPGIHPAYASTEVHWIPIECYTNLEFARRSTAADVWAFGTTLWEIFAYGENIKQTNHFESMKFYASGKRLSKPPDCSIEIYNLMLECWDSDFHRRKQPQAIMRDINQILYQVYDSRRVHSYAKLFTDKPTNIFRGLSSGSSTHSLFSNKTDSTYLGSKGELISVPDMADNDLHDLSVTPNSMNGNFEKNWQLGFQDVNVNDDTFSCNFSTMFSNLNFSVSTSVSSLNSISTMQSIFELDADCNVILQGRIGQGFYGEVFKGTLEYLGDKDSEPRQVAVKKLKTTAVSTCLQDFEREISIMKTLKHPNIVEILGVLQEPEISLVMEFVQHGSLQSYLKIYRDSLSINQLLKYALDIALGMDYLGLKHVVHRDLAARNILVVDENHVKISDFGLAQVMGSNEYYILKTNRELPIKWYAPESLRDGKFSTRSDVWSYGVTMCEMFGHGEEPKLPNPDNIKVEGREQQILLNAIESGARFPCPAVCPQAIYVRIIYPCWNANPHDRPLFTELEKEIQDLLTHY